MVFETTAYADSAIKPTSLLDHTKGDPKRVCCDCQFQHSAMMETVPQGSINTPFCRKAIRRIWSRSILDGITTP